MIPVSNIPVSKEIAAAREIGQKFGFDEVIILMVDSEKRQIEGACYGVTRVQNDQAAELMNVAWGAAVEHLGGLDEHGKYPAIQGE